MKKSDIGTELIFNIVDEDKVAVDLTNATAVKLILKLGSTRTAKDCTIVNAANGQVKYVVENGILAISGLLKMEVTVTFADGDFFTTETISETIEDVL